MQFIGLGIGFAILALVVLLFATRVLFAERWLMGWLRGMFGLTLLGTAVAGGLIAYDISTYQQIPSDKPLLMLSAQAEGPQRYRINILEGAVERSFLLDGELWQLDVRQLKWKGLADLIGLKQGYRLETLSGRFFSMEQQDLAQFTRVELAKSLYGADFWQGLRTLNKDLFVVEANALRVNYLPIADGAVYSVSLAPTGLLAKPLNRAAQQALKDWQ
ncbi:hypothetical protein FXF61_07030 [Pseudomonas sp. C27(2019)]|uniref:hypothetical protein n=1 Tax=Pseudomonas sp. C27(2019) TaxID=2604941 RepID=UPI001247A761|nr:hypothetical protein [Pseudomonas sp. C27(2019)]QEY58939.1 hypothetical protein FXF61_07030 [Pseudomonas sp. C27(2019)]